MRRNNCRTRAAALGLALAMGAALAAPAPAKAQPVTGEPRSQVCQTRQAPDGRADAAGEPAVYAVYDAAPAGAAGFCGCQSAARAGSQPPGSVWIKTMAQPETDRGGACAAPTGSAAPDAPDGEPDQDLTGLLLLLVWGFIWLLGALCWRFAMRTGLLFRPKPVAPPKPPRSGGDPGFACMSVFYGPQRLGQPAPKSERPAPVRAAPPKVGPSVLGCVAAAAGVASVAVPLFALPSWLALVLGVTQLGGKQSIATRRLALAALLMGCVSGVGNIVLFMMV